MTQRQVLVVADREDLGVRAAVARGCPRPRAGVVGRRGWSSSRATTSRPLDGATASVPTAVHTRDSCSPERRGSSSPTRTSPPCCSARRRGWCHRVSAGHRRTTSATPGPSSTRCSSAGSPRWGPRSSTHSRAAAPAGPAWSPARWRQVASDVGLPVSEADVHRSVLVTGAHVTGAASAREAQGCRELADRAGCRHLEISFTARDEVCNAAPVPALVEPAHVAATTALLTEVAA